MLLPDARPRGIVTVRILPILPDKSVENAPLLLKSAFLLGIFAIRVTSCNTGGRPFFFVSASNNLAASSYRLGS